MARARQTGQPYNPRDRNIARTGGGGAATILDATYAFGDSFPEGGSGGGGGYQYFMAQMARLFQSMTMAATYTNFAVSGSTIAQCRTAWLARTTHAARNIIWTGRNSMAQTAATNIADMAAIVADRKTGEEVWILGVHNFSDGAEPSGSANYIKIAAMNVGFAALADNVNVFYFASREELIFSALIDATDPAYAADAANVVADEPPRSLVETSGNKLHPNAMGYNVIARPLAWRMYQQWLTRTSKTRPNLVTNGDFVANVNSWIAGDTATIVWDATQAGKVTGGGAFRSMLQDFAASGQTGKNTIMVFDLLAITGKLKVGLSDRYFSGSFLSPPSPGDPPAEVSFDGYTAATESAGQTFAKRKLHKLFMIGVCGADTVGGQFKSNNDSSCTWMIDNVIAHNTTP